MSGQLCAYPPTRAKSWREHHTRPKFDTSTEFGITLESDCQLYGYYWLCFDLIPVVVSFAASPPADDRANQVPVEETMVMATLEKVGLE